MFIFLVVMDFQTCIFPETCDVRRYEMYLQLLTQNSFCAPSLAYFEREHAQVQERDDRALHCKAGSCASKLAPMRKGRFSLLFKDTVRTLILHGTALSMHFSIPFSHKSLTGHACELIHLMH